MKKRRRFITLNANKEKKRLGVSGGDSGGVHGGASRENLKKKKMKIERPPSFPYRKYFKR